MEHDEYVALRQALAEEIRPLLVVAYYGGARTGELKRLKWTQVDLKELAITLDPGATKKDQGASCRSTRRWSSG
jgi:integrase